MLDEVDTFEYYLAERLHKTLGEIRAMPNSEYVEWRAYTRYRLEMEKLYAR